MGTMSKLKPEQIKIGMKLRCVSKTNWHREGGVYEVGWAPSTDQMFKEMYPSTIKEINGPNVHFTNQPNWVPLSSFESTKKLTVLI